MESKRKKLSMKIRNLFFCVLMANSQLVQARTIYLSPTESQAAAATIPIISREEPVDCASECKDALASADSLISEQSKLIENQVKQIEVQQDLLREVNKGYEAEKSRADAWYRDPLMVIPTALLIGFIAGQALERK